MVIMMIEMEWGFSIETRIRMRISMILGMENGMEICTVNGFKKRGLRFIMGLCVGVEKGLGLRLACGFGQRLKQIE